MCFWALFHALFVCFWRVVLAGTPQRTTRRDQSESAKTSFEDGSVFCFAPTVFSLFFCVFLCFLFFVFISVFLIARYFLFIRQKKTKKLKTQKKTQKTKRFFLWRDFVERGLLRLRRAGLSSAKHGGPQAQRIWTRLRSARGPPLGRRPATGQLPGQQNDVKKAR